MSFQREIFKDSGPIYLTPIDWDDQDHQRTILSSLVEGVYGQERDRMQDGQGSQDKTSCWWEFSGFQLYKPLKHGKSIIGAIYERKSNAFSSHDAEQNAPKYVVAFRGTIIKHRGDLKLDAKLFFRTFHKDGRVKDAVDAVMELAGSVTNPSSDIWLAGHSLGSAMALLVGKHCMTQKGWPVETYLFNPPYLPPSIWIMSQNEALNDVAHSTRSLAIFLVARAVKGKKAYAEDEFVKLCNWVPKMFVNADDPICSRYIRYFQKRGKIDKKHFGKFEMVAMQNSLRSLAFGNKNVPLHLLPSADLTINETHQAPGCRQAHGLQQLLDDFRQAHSLRQWWHHKLVVTSQKHRMSFHNA